MKFSIGNHKRAIVLALFSLLIIVVVTVVIYNQMSEQRGREYPIPETFKYIQRDLARGSLVDICDLKPDVYTQPEFYPTWERTKDLAVPKSRWGVTGFGAYPGEIGYTAKNMSTGDSFTACTFIRSGWAIQTYQGMHLEMDYNKELFNVIVTPNELLLSPTYPEYVKGWVNRVSIKVTAKQDIPAGSYTFSMTSSPPSLQKQREYYSYVMDIQNYPWYSCGLFEKDCDENVIEMRKRTYYNAGTFQAEKFYNIELITG